MFIDDVFLIKPILDNSGMGFIAPQPNAGYSAFYDEKLENGQWKYYFHPGEFRWPVQSHLDCDCLDHLSIDCFCADAEKGFNLNHLRALAFSHAMSALWPGARISGTLILKKGCPPGQVSRFYGLLDLLQSKVQIHKDEEFSSVRLTEEFSGGIKTIDENGNFTRARDILAFIRCNRPTHYIASIDHMRELAEVGQTDVHCMSGIVNGDKTDMLDQLDHLKESYFDRGEIANRLAWNVVAYASFVGRRNTVISLDINAALGAYLYDLVERILQEAAYNLTKEELVLKIKDVRILGFAAYEPYYAYLSAQKFDPYSLAKYTLQLARSIEQYWASEGPDRYAFRWSATESLMPLMRAMMRLGLFIPDIKERR